MSQKQNSDRFLQTIFGGIVEYDIKNRYDDIEVYKE